MKNKTRFIGRLLLLAVIALPTAAMAQYSLTGKVQERETGEACVTPIYHIYNSTDTIHPIINNVGDIDGKIEQKLTKSGDYRIVVEYTGLSPETLSFTVSDAKPEVDLGIISLHPVVGMLSEVVVSVKKPIVVTDGANLTYSVEDDPTSSGNTILEMLRKVPMVTVDGQDNIRVNGSTDFKIYLNGRPNPMFDSDASRILKAMPAAAISKIEVLTEPGAKYDAEGIGGILNIVTLGENKSVTKDGVAGNINASINNRNASAGGYVLAKIGNVTASASLNYSNGKFNKARSYSDSETEYLTGNLAGYKSTENYITEGNPFEYLGGDLDMSWEPNKNNLFTASFSISDVSGGQHGGLTSTMMLPDGTTLWRQKSHTDINFKMPTYSVNASYQHNFNAEGTSLTTSYQYTRKNQDITLLQDFFEAENYPIEATHTEQQMLYHNNEHTAQIDFTQPIGASQSIELGAKGIFRDNHADSETTGSTPDNVEMRQYQDIMSGYAAYSGTFGKLTATAGVRYEHTHAGIDYKSGGMKDFSTNYGDIVPNASLSYSPQVGRIWRLAYNMRISRPTIEQLNPYSWGASPTSIHTGNPDLESQHANSISLGYSAFTPFMTFNVKAVYQFVNNMICSFDKIENETVISTYANDGDMHEATLSGFANFNFSSRLQAGLNFSVGYENYSMKEENISNSGVPVNFGANVNYTMPAEIRLSAYGGMMTRHYTLQGYYSGWHYYGIAFTKSVLPKKNLDITLSANNFLNDSMSFRSETKTKDAIQTGKNRMKNWYAGLSLTYNFGNLKGSRVKSTKAVIDNDDAVKTDNGQNQGSGMM